MNRREFNVVAACDSFKESISAHEAHKAIEGGLKAQLPSASFTSCPVADGGEGTIEAITQSRADAAHHTVSTMGPLPDQIVQATWAMLDEPMPTALIEICASAGFSLILKPKRNPMHTTTFGVGQLIQDALEHNPRQIILWLGSSATCDGGTGLAQALGAQFVLDDGTVLDQTSRPITGADLANLRAVHPIPPDHLRCKDGTSPEILAACDVTNPLTGHEGSARVFAPQKGASPSDVEVLDRGLLKLAELCPVVDPQMPRTGSAGGLGFGLASFLNARLVSGIDLLLDLIHFDTHINAADLIITGEGTLDRQTRSGKAVLGVTRRAATRRIPVIALVGHVDRQSLPADLAQQFHAIHAVTDIAIDTEDAMQNTAAHLTALTKRALAEFPLPPDTAA